MESIETSVAIAKRVLAIESQAVADLVERIGDEFAQTIELILSCKGKVVICGMGKPGLIGQKISATLASTGTPSLSLHPADALHGDAGRMTTEDVILVLSNSGETEEITRLLPVIKRIGAKIIALTGNLQSTLAKYSDILLNTAVKEEACSLGLAPTSSTTAMLAMGDAIAMALLDRRGFEKEDYAVLHPGGSLGRKLLLRVEDIMRQGAENPVVNEETSLQEVIIAITKGRAGSASVVNAENKLVGIFTDGDLRRLIEKGKEILSRKVKEVMTRDPLVITKDQLAEEASRILNSRNIDEIPVIDENRVPIGLVDIQDLLKAGIV